MCFLSICRIFDEIVITHNRDESINRPWSQEPSKHKIGNKRVTAPIDPISGGTWIGTTENETLAILNGAYEKHEKKPSYAKSRGTLIMDYFSSDLIFEDYIYGLNMPDYEPFTLLKVNHVDFIVTEVVWDGEVLDLNNTDIKNIPLVYSSSTLYDSQTKKDRKTYFQNWFDLTKDADSIFDLHSKEGINFSENFRVQISEEIKTISTIQIHISGTINLKFKDYLTGKIILINSHFTTAV